MLRFVTVRAQHPAADVVGGVIPQDPVHKAGLAVEVVSRLAQRLDALLEDGREALSVVVDLEVPVRSALRALEACRYHLGEGPLTVETGTAHGAEL